MYDKTKVNKKTGSNKKEKFSFKPAPTVDSKDVRPQWMTKSVDT